MTEEFISGIDEYQKAFSIHRKSNNKKRTVTAMRKCPVCGKRTPYSVQKQYCDGCGTCYKDFVIRDINGKIRE